MKIFAGFSGQSAAMLAAILSIFSKECLYRYTKVAIEVHFVFEKTMPIHDAHEYATNVEHH